jgi:hypothetical protein
MSPREKEEPGTPDWAVPIEFDMMERLGHQEERRPGATRGIGDTRAVSAQTKANPLRRERHGRPRFEFSSPTERIAHVSPAGDFCAAGFQSGLCQIGLKKWFSRSTLVKT